MLSPTRFQFGKPSSVWASSSELHNCGEFNARRLLQHAAPRTMIPMSADELKSAFEPVTPPPPYTAVPLPPPQHPTAGTHTDDPVPPGIMDPARSTSKRTCFPLRLGCATVVSCGLGGYYCTLLHGSTKPLFIVCCRQSCEDCVWPCCCITLGGFCCVWPLWALVVHTSCGVGDKARFPMCNGVY